MESSGNFFQITTKLYSLFHRELINFVVKFISFFEFYLGSFAWIDLLSTYYLITALAQVQMVQIDTKPIAPVRFNNTLARDWAPKKARETTLSRLLKNLGDLRIKVLSRCKHLTRHRTRTKERVLPNKSTNFWLTLIDIIENKFKIWGLLRKCSIDLKGFFKKV